MPSESRFDEAKACFQGKIDALHLVRAVSPTHTEVRVFKVFVLIKTQNLAGERIFLQKFGSFIFYA